MRPDHYMPKLLQLIKANIDKPKLFRVDAKTNADQATIYLYDAIDNNFGINAADFVKEFNAITAPTIHLRIHSPGGDAFAGRAMATAVSQHPSNVIAHIDGIAASAATYVALAADSVNMAEGGFFMIHNAWTLAFGNSSDLRSMAELLDKVDATIVKDYIKKTGADVAQIQMWMAAETWFTSQEALNNKFIDAIATTEKVKNSWDLTAYDNAPKILTEALPVENDQLENDQRNVLERRLRLLEKFAA